MSLDKRIFKGSWWLPSAPNEKLNGELIVEPNGKIQLELYSTFQWQVSGISFEDRDYSAILGRCYAPNSHMVDISLFNCHSSIKLNLSSDYPISCFNCRYALIGIHTDSMDNQLFNKAYVGFEVLTYWNPPKRVRLITAEQSIEVLIDKSQLNDTLASVNVDDDLTLNIDQSYSYRHDFQEFYVRQTTRLELIKDKMCAKQVLYNTFKFEQFLSFATLSPIEHSSIILYSKEKCQIFDDGERYFHPIELITCLYRYEKTQEINPSEFLFKFDDIASKFGNIYKKYYTNKDIVLIWSNMIDSLEKKQYYTSNDFLVVAQALDGYSFRFRKESGYLQQLIKLRDEFRDITKVSLTEDELKRTRASRDYFTHILKLDEKRKRNALDGVALYELTKKLRILLICCILDFLGIDKEQINNMLNKSNSRFLR